MRRRLQPCAWATEVAALRKTRVNPMGLPPASSTRAAAPRATGVGQAHAKLHEPRDAERARAVPRRISRAPGGLVARTALRSSVRSRGAWPQRMAPAGFCAWRSAQCRHGASAAHARSSWARPAPVGSLFEYTCLHNGGPGQARLSAVFFVRGGNSHPCVQPGTRFLIILYFGLFCTCTITPLRFSYSPRQLSS